MNTTRYDLHDLPGKFHPRSRGEYLLMIWIIGMMRGSSPLTRGIPRDGRLHFVVPEVHPRSRGEYYDDGVCDICNGGSSPLTRGIPSAINDWEIANGFIPAHAGNTSGQKSALCSMKVHPRSRGEYMGRNKAAYYLLGSPPLTRGILASAAISVTPVGFTPAHAGNTGYAKIPPL